MNNNENENPSAFLRTLLVLLGTDAKGHPNFTRKHAAYFHALSAHMCRTGVFPGVSFDQERMQALVDKETELTVARKKESGCSDLYVTHSIEGEVNLLFAVFEWIRDHGGKLVNETQVATELLRKLSSERNNLTVAHDSDEGKELEDCSLRSLVLALGTSVFSLRTWNCIGFHALSYPFNGSHGTSMLVPRKPRADGQHRYVTIRPGLVFALWLLSGAFLAHGAFNPNKKKRVRKYLCDSDDEEEEEEGAPPKEGEKRNEPGTKQSPIDLSE